jgi:hypothetical protein
VGLLQTYLHFLSKDSSLTIRDVENRVLLHEKKFEIASSKKFRQVSWQSTPLTADWVLQSWPAIVRSSLKVLLLMMSTLHVSDLQAIFVVFILNHFIPCFYF